MMRCSLILWCLAAVGGPLPLRAQPAAADPLAVIPSNCLGYILVRDGQTLDRQLAELGATLAFEPLHLATLFDKKLRLGPQIRSDGAMAIVAMPADDPTAVGNNAVLVLPCTDVEAWLSAFPTTRTESNLWRSELVWGPTFVGARGGYALLGTSESAVNGVLSATESVQVRLAPAAVTATASAAVTSYINLATAAAGPLGAAWFDAEAPAFPAAAWLKQCTDLHIAADVDGSGVRATVRAAARGGSILAGLVAFDETTRRAAPTLPAADLLVAAYGTVSRQQGETIGRLVDDWLSMPAIERLPDPGALTSARDALRQLIHAVRASEVSLVSIPPDPNGTAAALAILRVESASSWLTDARELVAALGSDALLAGGANPYYSAVAWDHAADVIHQTSVHHVTVTRPARGDAPPSGLARGLFAGPQVRLQLAALDGESVALCVGGHPRDMGRLIATSRGIQPPLAPASTPSVGTQATVHVEPSRAVDLLRTLARLQGQVDSAPPRPVQSGGLATVHFRGTAGPDLQIDIHLPAETLPHLQELIAAWRHASAP